jgi:hypothetical protein
MVHALPQRLQLSLSLLVSVLPALQHCTFGAPLQAGPPLHWQLAPTQVLLLVQPGQQLVVVHTPERQLWHAPQAVSHEPQRPGSLEVSKQPPGAPDAEVAQQVSLTVQARGGLVPGQMHMPFKHCSPRLHDEPQPPQLSWLLSGSTHAPTQQRCPDGQAGPLPHAHVPPLHCSPSAHALEHVPQFMTSSARCAQPDGQHVSPPAQICP